MTKLKTNTFATLVVMTTILIASIGETNVIFAKSINTTGREGKKVSFSCNHAKDTGMSLGGDEKSSREKIIEETLSDLYFVEDTIDIVVDETEKALNRD